MATISNSKWWLTFACAAALTATGNAQAYTPPPPPLTTAPCVPTKKDPCDAPPVKTPKLPPGTADKFPFPGEAPASATPATAPAFPFPGEPAEAPAAATPASTKAPFPFPGEPAESGSSSSSSSSSNTPPADAVPNPDQPALKDAGSTGSTRFQRKHLAKVEDLDKRELDDLDVSHYYITTGNYTAAYLRAQDAVKLYPDDEHAHLALAIAAQKLKKSEEATAEYTEYLRLAPDGEQAKQAKLALVALAHK